MKIAIGMVVRNLLSASPLTEFLDNAEKYGHPIDRVIVAYSHQLAPEAAAVLQSRTKLSLIRLMCQQTQIDFDLSARSHTDTAFSHSRTGEREW